MPRKSKRELWQAIEGFEPQPEWEVSSSVTEVMDREKAEEKGREILGDVEGTTRLATVQDSDGDVVAGSPESRVPESVDLVEVSPDSHEGA